MENHYFNIETVPYIGMDWVYVNAKKILLSALGKIENTDKYVLIKQYRPPVKQWVVTAPMGAFPEGTPEELLKITKYEIEGETGRKIKSIEPWFETFRSCGLTNEKCICIVVFIAKKHFPRFYIQRKR